MLIVKKYITIHQVEPQHWDSILSQDDVFHTHRFIRIVEDSKIENADFFYLLFYDEQQLVATTVFSAFKVSLDLFISNSGLVRTLKRVFPNLFTIKILVCGLPASFGQLNLKVADVKYAGIVSSLIANEMKSLTKKLGISLMTLKEFGEKDIIRFNGLEKEGFFPANSIPYMNLAVSWESFEKYLASLRHHYRRKILLSLKKINQLQPIIISANEYDHSSTQPALILLEPDENFSDEFYRMYLAVMNRATTKLEILNRDFFRNLFQQKNAYRLLKLVTKGKVISTAVLIFNDESITFMLVGRENEKDKFDSYFNLVYGIIALAIQCGCKKIRMGQTAYWVKQCVGAIPEPKLIYFASRKPIVHWVLKSLRKVIFPELRLNPIDVFHKTDQVNNQPGKYEQYHYNI